jgi:hypothetical protein
MIEFRPSDQNEVRSAEIERHLKKLDLEMASPNIKEIKHAELNALYRQLNAERDLLRQERAKGGSGVPG